MLKSLFSTLLLVLQFHFLLCSGQAPDPDYTTLGPCAVRKVEVAPLHLPAESGCGYKCTLSVHVHVPAADGSSAGCPAGPYPVVAFFGGFQTFSTYYNSYALRLASWGFAVVQYDLPLLTIVADQTELGYFPYLLKHISTQPDVSELLDLKRLATAGHSRGGKLAALHYAGTPGVMTAFLIDPVDSTVFSPPSPQNPSAAQALKGKNKRLGITGGGIPGPCNPVGSNYPVFWDVVGPGSWLEVVPQAGHMQFTNITQTLIEVSLDLICHKGKTTHEHVISLTAPALVAWMDAAFRGSSTAAATAAEVLGPQQAATTVHHTSKQQSRHLSWLLPGPSAADVQQLQTAVLADIRSQRPHRQDDRQQPVGSLRAFFEWVKQEQAAGEITFSIK